MIRGFVIDFDEEAQLLSLQPSQVSVNEAGVWVRQALSA